MTPLQEDTRSRVLRALQDNPRLTQRELPERLGVSYESLKAEIEAVSRELEQETQLADGTARSSDPLAAPPLARADPR